MQPDFEKSAAAMVAGTQKAIDLAVAPLLKRIEELEARPIAEKGERGEPGLPGEKGERGETGIGIAGALIDRSDILILTLSDGTTKELGVVVGKDGRDGTDGKDGEKGEPGKDGRDGFKLEDFDIKQEDGRLLILSFDQGDIRYEYEVTLQHPIYCGIYKADQEYMIGDVVTWGGSAWHCDAPTKEKPDIGPWTLMVKKGRDGKDTKNG